MSATLKVNGQVMTTKGVPNDTPLLWVLREELGLTGVKYGCGAGVCGACTVTIDDVAVRACVTSLEEALGKSVVTIEAVTASRSNPVQAAWIAEEVPQCGYCQPGMVMATIGLLKANPDPTDAEIDEAITNICRCGTYPQIRLAIHRAARAMAAAKA
ncbi:MAG: (2Fe-2S)-binding protein [Pseudomonadota bacterium]|uniref:(2Fe-2S)-binding protein n=1 Tax=Phenylobacterium sp. TaxID=1871053 RepID=UPI0025CDC354|nr:(2Fe-2S)-binding protein [Phenylobacterium sp.]